MRIILLFMLLLLTDKVIKAQDISLSNLEWRVTSSFDVQNGMTLEEEGFLITRVNQKIEWRAWDGSTKQIYDIDKILGSWNNVNQAGSITYQVNSNGDEATITIERINNQCVARIMKLQDGDPIVYELQLGSVIKL